MAEINPRQTLRANLRRLRALNDWSQAKLAETVGASTSHIAEIELERRFPSAELLAKLATSLGVTPAQLLMDEQELHDFSALRGDAVYQKVAHQLLEEVRKLAQGNNQ
jgi:transcriptional regulator with XRE-family HTH domain